MRVPLLCLGVCAGLVLLTSSLNAAALPTIPDDPQALAGWFAEQGHRREGSVAEARVFDALTRWFGDRVEVQTAGFEAMEGEHSFSKRLWFRIEGTRPGELVVVAPTDGSNDLGLAWAATWAHDALERGTPVTLVFLFTGAERGSGDAAGLGSRAFLQDYYPTVPAATVYLDAGTDLRVELTTESGLLPSPLWMVQGLSEALQRHGLPPRFAGTAPSLFRLDLPERRTALAPWLNRSIPALWISQGPASIAVVRSLEAFAESLTNGVPARWDRHYLAFDVGFARFFWSQQTYLVVFLVVIALLIFGYAVAGRGRRGSLRILGTGFWQVPVLFAFLFLALYVGTVLSTILQEARGLPQFWRSSPLLVWGFKAMVAVSLYLFLFLPFRRSPLSRDPDFYGQAALAWLGLLVMGSAALELSFSFYFLWALVWCAVLVVVPWRWMKLVALVLGPLWLAKALWDVLGPQPDLALSDGAIGSPLAGNFALTMLIFPFLLQINAWHFSGRSHQDRDEGLRAAAQLAVFGLLTLVMGVAVLRTPTPEGRVPSAEEVVLDLGASPRQDLWTTKVSRSAFLDRTVWTLVFDGGTPPESVDVELESNDSLTVYECSFPLTLDAEGTKARILIGRQPPLPLELRITLPRETSARLTVKVHLAGTVPMELTDHVELRP